jgi:hypothetical protein
LYGGMRVKTEDRPQKSWTISYRSPPHSLHDQMKTTEERHNHICCNNQRVREAREWSPHISRKVQNQTWNKSRTNPTIEPTRREI